MYMSLYVFLAAILFFSYFYTKTAKTSLPNIRFGFSALKSFEKSCLSTFPQKCLRHWHLVEITLHVLGMCKHMAFGSRWPSCVYLSIRLVTLYWLKLHSNSFFRSLVQTIKVISASLPMLWHFRSFVWRRFWIETRLSLTKNQVNIGFRLQVISFLVFFMAAILFCWY